jgi:D-threo-aldose 1-dehydrogenase
MPILQRTLSDAKLSLSELGLGGGAFGNLYKAVRDRDACDAIDAASRAGMTYFDVAPLYGNGLAELRLGAGLRQLKDQKVIISTKVGWGLRVIGEGATRTLPFGHTENFVKYPDYSYDATMRSLEDSMQRLGTNKIDMVFIHDVDRRTHGARYQSMFGAAMRGAYLALDELRTAGVIQAIGVGVNEWEPCVEFATAGDFDCFLLAGRYTLLEQDAIETMLPMCEKRNIGVVIGGVYNSGILATGATKEATYDYAGAPALIVERVRAIERLCVEHDVEMKAAALQFPLLQPSVVSVIAGARCAQEVLVNAEMLKSPIPLAFWQEMKSEQLIRDEVLLPASI